MTSPPLFPDASGSLVLPGPAGALEVAVDLPEDDVTRQPVVAIVCHPLPTEGGTMHNKVVTMAARALRELGVATVRFNFRGTGTSEGAYDGGDGERADLRAVAEWLRETRPDDQFWLAGFSFGAYVSLAMAAELQPSLLISIANSDCSVSPSSGPCRRIRRRTRRSGSRGGGRQRWRRPSSCP